MACGKCGCDHEAAFAEHCSSNANLICVGRSQVDGCGDVLTNEERHFYGSTCEACEVEWHERITAWRKGGDDAEFDSDFGVPKEPAH